MKNDLITVVMKSTQRCNLRCKYCYHAEEGFTNSDMSLEVVEKVYQTVLPYYNRVKFIWHGGEPLLLPQKFYKEVIELQNKYRRDKSQRITNMLQTNGTLMTEGMVDFFIENRFRIGVSYDGCSNEELRGGTDKTLRAVELLKERGIQTGAICVVGTHNLKKLIKTYQHFNHKGINVTFNPMFKSGNAKEGNLCIEDYNEYVDSIKQLFEHWIYDKECKIKVMSFENDVYLLIHDERRVCTMTDCINRYISIESNGDMNPCGRPFHGNYHLGNIFDFDNIKNVYMTEKYKLYARANVQRHNKCKEKCDIYYYCQANCSNLADIEGGVERIPQFTCYSNRAILKYIRQRLNCIREEIFVNGNLDFNPFLVNAFLGSPKDNHFFECI